MSADKFRAEGTTIYRRPEQTATGRKLGFPLCEVNDHIEDAERVTELLAAFLNKHWKDENQS